jgi:mRNA-degrading endonuclease RelE of RelBE toxin-antitoxin system
LAYKVVVRPSAQRQLGKLRGSLSIVLHGAILSLSDPRPPGAIKLVGSSDLWRIRIRIDGRPWRVVYQIDDRANVVRVVRVVRRDEGAYRGL